MKGPSRWSRRSVLCAGCSTLAVGCGKGTGQGASTAPGSKAPDTGPPPDDSAAPAASTDCSVRPGSESEGWVPISLDAYPELREPGGQVWISDPDHLLYVLLVCTAPGCWAAVWSTCTHGACIVEWDHGAGEVWCPCHGSRFSTKGTVLQGPATQALTAFEVGERDGVLWVKRW